MKTIVLTFDDGILSHLEFAAPLLKQYGFGATFFISGQLIEDPARKGFVEWNQLSQFEGFELGNHFNNHMVASEATDEEVIKHIKWVENKFAVLKLPKPVSLSYPGFNRNIHTMDLVRQMGYKYARGGPDKVCPFSQYQEGAFGGGYDPAWDNQFNIPSSLFGKKFGFDEFVQSLDWMKESPIGVYCIHGFTGDGHIGGALDEFTDISQEGFERCLDHLYVNDYKVIALKDVDSDFHIGMEQATKYKEEFIAEHGNKYHEQFTRRMRGEE